MHIHDLILLVIESEGEKGLRGRTLLQKKFYFLSVLNSRRLFIQTSASVTSFRGTKVDIISTKRRLLFREHQNICLVVHFLISARVCRRAIHGASQRAMNRTTTNLTLYGLVK